MGEARRRGSFEERKRAAIKRDKKILIDQMGERDEHLMAMLSAGLKPFLSSLSNDDWRTRRNLIVESLKVYPESTLLEQAKPIRIREDEIGWYLFLVEQTLEDPLCLEISQAQRILPFFVAIGERWEHASKVDGIQRKITELLTRYKASPDGLIFEILVALAYAEKGWDVTLIEEKPPEKSPDMVVRNDVIELFVECKRLDRRTAYSENERNEFLRLWDAATPMLIKNKQWIWLNAVFHAEVHTLPKNFLANILLNTLPITREQLIHESADATIKARLIDRQAVKSHLDNFRVKEPSPMLGALLGSDWAPYNSQVSLIHFGKRSRVVDCEAPVLGTYVESIDWACGITRKFDSEESINKKARDITKLLSNAVKQVPKDNPSIVHIAAETLEGRDVEIRRTDKVMSKISSFVIDKPVLAVRFHRFQSNSRTNMLYEFDETVERFQRDGVIIDLIPSQVVVPLKAEKHSGAHWNLYQ